MASERVEEMVCPHCDGTGKGPQNGEWGRVLTAYGVLPAECQNCLGTGVITLEATEVERSSPKVKGSETT